MSRAAIEELLYLLDGAFEQDDEHSLLDSLRTLTDEELLVLPPGGHRSIAAIVGHAGACKYMYDSHAFDDGSIT